MIFTLKYLLRLNASQASLLLLLLPLLLLLLLPEYIREVPGTPAKMQHNTVKKPQEDSAKDEEEMDVTGLLCE